MVLLAKCTLRVLLAGYTTGLGNSSSVYTNRVHLAGYTTRVLLTGYTTRVLLAGYTTSLGTFSRVYY